MYEDGINDAQEKLRGGESACDSGAENVAGEIYEPADHVMLKDQSCPEIGASAVILDFIQDRSW